MTTDFWTDRSDFTKIHIPSGVVKQGENDVSIFCRNLVWTGGISHNDFIIREETEKVKIVIDKDNHLFDSPSQLSDVSPDYKMIYSDSLSTESKKAYIVEMQSAGDRTIRAYYFVPRKESAHYAILHLPGYGTGFEDLSYLRNDETDRIDMALCVRGHCISADVFNPGFGIPGIWGVYCLSQG